MTPAIRRRLASLAAHADSGDGLDGLCAFVDAYRASPPEQQPDGTSPFPDETLLQRFRAWVQREWTR